MASEESPETHPLLEDDASTYPPKRLTKAARLFNGFRLRISLKRRILLIVFLLVFIAAILFLFSSFIRHDFGFDSPIVDLGYAQYQGKFDSGNNVTDFLGIRYASPPVGQYRFAAPEPPAHVSGILQAHVQPPPCIEVPGVGEASRNPFSKVNQGHQEFKDVSEFAMKGSEDCLFLNVHIPGGGIPVEGLPTIVWIHGGGYSAGSVPAYPGSDLIRASGHRVVVVAIQYRLGLFGFLSGEIVKAGGALNAGLLDQEFALRWVQDHISKFGGDPEKVVIWGESAGAGSVMQHIISRGGETNPKLFRAAMTSSTYFPPQYDYNSRVSEALYNEVVSQANCGLSSNTLACLREAKPELLAEVNTNISLNAFFGTFLFVPVVDGTFILERPTEALRKRKVNGENLLAVVNTNEGSMFVDQRMKLNTAQYAGQLFPEFEPEQAQEVVNRYQDLGSSLDQANTIMGEAIFTCPTYFLLEAFPNAFKGEFALPPALHSHDIAYYFTSWGPKYSNQNFIDAFSQAFISFAISLDPNIKFDSTNITPPWSRFKDGLTEMVFNGTEHSEDIHSKVTDAGLIERCRFWEGIGALTGQ